MKRYLLFFVFLSSVFSCVPKKIFTDLENRHALALYENDSLLRNNQKQEQDLNKMSSNLKNVSEEIDTLKRAYKQKIYSYDNLESNYKRKEAELEALYSSNKSIMSDAQSKSVSYLADIEKKQKDIIALRDSLDKKEQDLIDREIRLRQLEGMLSQLQESQNKLRQSIKNALSGFEGKGISISQRNGKVYVSLENKLLFPSGSFSVNEEGKKAINELAKVLAKEPNLKIMIEGHTDNVPYKSTGQLSDNWDLSVVRATAIVRQILLTTGIDAKNITAAGRAEFDPLRENTTQENKARNRRIEVVLTPDLSDIESLLNN